MTDEFDEEISAGDITEGEIESQDDKSEWDDWHWQIRNRITTIEQLEDYIDLTDDEREEIKEVSKFYRWGISPYYASLMYKRDRNCPIRMQSIPSISELSDSYGIPDPLSEEKMHPVPALTQRYPDRLILYVTNQCASYCRHCQRRRLIGHVDSPTPKEKVYEGIDWIRDHKEIRDVLLTGGDALMVSDDWLETIIQELRDIRHVEIIRIGTRTPVTLPQRITDELCEMLQRYHPIWLNTQFNHPKEVTKESAKACDRLTRAGIPLGNQTVLLRGINDSPEIMMKLMHELLKIRVRPYYIFQCNPVKGTEHFRTPIEKGIEIMERLRGWTSGLAIPTYVINAPGGGGKIPAMPQYIISWGDGYVLLRNWEGKVVKYPNPR